MIVPSLPFNAIPCQDIVQINGIRSRRQGGCWLALVQSIQVAEEMNNASKVHSIEPVRVCLYTFVLHHKTLFNDKEPYSSHTLRVHTKMRGEAASLGH